MVKTHNIEKFDNNLYIPHEIYKSVKYITLYQNSQLIYLIKQYFKNNT